MPVPIALAMVTRPARYADIRPGTPSAESERKTQRVEEVVVDAAIDDVDALRALRGPHVDEAAAHEQVLAFDQLDAHLLREERMLEVRAVVRARSQHHDHRCGDAGGCDAREVFEQPVRVVLDGRDAVEGEQFGKQPHHHLAVFEHVGDARRHAQVVFEDVELALARAHDVDAGDVRVDAAGHVESLHFGAVLVIAEDLFGTQHACAQDVLAVVDVRDERVERLHALAQSRRELAPFVGREDARHDVERNQPLVAVLLAVHRERDADPVKEAVGFSALLAQRVLGFADQPVGVDRIGQAHLPVGGVHLVERRDGGGGRFH